MEELLLTSLIWEDIPSISSDLWFTLQGINISPKNGTFEDDFPNFPRWDMLIPWRVSHLDVSENRGTPNSSILIGFSFINHPFWGTPIFGNTHLVHPQDVSFNSNGFVWGYREPLSAVAGRWDRKERLDQYLWESGNLAERKKMPAFWSAEKFPLKINGWKMYSLLK